MKRSDPWRDLPEARVTQISARRVTAERRWPLYWGVDGDRRLLLIFQHGAAVRLSRRLPRYRSLRFERQSAESGSDKRIIIRLLDPAQRDVFRRFCRYIVDATLIAQTEEQAMERLLARTWRWNRFIEDRRDRRLDDEEQRGLLGALVVLEKHLLPALGALEAVRCWVGPLDAPHDFEISRIHVQVMARGNAPRVTVSSERQLDSGDANRLFLHVTEVTNAPGGGPHASTVTDIVNRICAVLAGRDMAAVERFEQRLGAAGFDWADDYSDKTWVVGQDALYEVREGFPRISPAMSAGAVGEVRHVISLPDCEAFRVVPASLPIVASGDPVTGEESATPNT